MLANWIRSYRENGYNVVIKQKVRNSPMPKQNPEIKAKLKGLIPLEYRELVLS